MSYGQIPLRKANENQCYSCGGETINADFNDCFIAASFIKNYNVLKKFGSSLAGFNNEHSCFGNWAMKYWSKIMQIDAYLHNV